MLDQDRDGRVADAVSRSGSTTEAALLAGVSRQTVMRVSERLKLDISHFCFRIRNRIQTRHTSRDDACEFQPRNILISWCYFLSYFTPFMRRTKGRESEDSSFRDSDATCPDTARRPSREKPPPSQPQRAPQRLPS